MAQQHAGPPAIVLMVSDYFPSRGGTTTQTRLHALEFARRGWDVTVLTRRVRTRMGSEKLEGITVRRIALPGRGRLAKILDLALTWWWLVRRRRKLDAVSVLLDADFAVAARAAGLGRSTVMTWVTRGDATHMLSGPLGRVRRFILRECSQVVLTPRMKEELRGLGVANVTIVPVPVDLSRYRPPSVDEKATALRDLGLDDGPIVLFVGHLQKRKGVDLLIRSFRQVLDAGLNANLVIVGGPIDSVDTHYVEALDEIVRESALSDHVIFVGPQDNVTNFLFAADIFCLSSHREGMPNVLLEAMACGLTCVAPASAGGDELLFDSAGLIPESNSPADLAGALIRLLSDPELRRTLGLSAVTRARQKHRPEQIAADYEALFLGKKADRAGH